METHTHTEIYSETQKVVFGYWDIEGEEFVPLLGNNIPEMAQKLHCSPELLDALEMFTANIRDAINADLTDIWRRLDEAGIP